MVHVKHAHLYCKIALLVQPKLYALSVSITLTHYHQQTIHANFVLLSWLTVSVVSIIQFALIVFTNIISISAMVALYAQKQSVIAPNALTITTLPHTYVLSVMMVS